MSLLNPVTILAILLALTVHEAAHAWVAKKLGDPTAEMEGRITLNPLAHLDPMGTVLFLLVGFGWGRPVPVDPRNFRNPVRDNAIVALAGPVSNLVIACACMAGLMLLPEAVVGQGAGLRLLKLFLQSSLALNLALMAFNLLPVAPLDGSKAVAPLIPLRYLDRYEEFLRIGPWVLLGILLLENLFGVPVLTWWVSTIAEGVLRVFAQIVPVAG